MTKFFRAATAISFVLLIMRAVTATAQAPAKEGSLTIGNIELGYPCPNIPYYHFKAGLRLPHPSIIEVEAVVNGKTLRATDLRKDGGMEDVNRPPIADRPPSGYGMAQDVSLYQQPQVIGWVKWQPGQDYVIRLTVRLKQSAHASDGDMVLTATRTLTAPGTPVFDSAWKSYKSVVVSETAGIDRAHEPVKVLLAFYPDEDHGLQREVRVAAFDPVSHVVTEVPSQIYDVQRSLAKDDLAPDKHGKPTRQVPLWLPTVTASLVFLADVPARSSRVYLVYYNNKKAPDALYHTDLHVQGKAPGLQVDNSQLTVTLSPHSGHLDQVVLKSRPDAPLFHHMETNGAVHWNPDIYAPPRAWTHTSDWSPPAHILSFAGPVLAKSEVWGTLPGVKEVDAAVRYEFYPGLPYFISSTSMRINQTLQCLSLRNAEIVFKRELITHAAWYDVLRDSVITYDVKNMADLTDLKMEADVPWITFYNEDAGIGFAGIQLEYANTGLESDTRLLNPYFYITAGPWIYWARGLSHPYLSSNMQQVIPVKKGSLFSEKWAYLIYTPDKGKAPYSTVVDWQKRLTHPLRIQVVEEVDDRVSRTLQEVYMKDGKTGWEGRKNKIVTDQPAAKDSTTVKKPDDSPSEFF